MWLLDGCSDILDLVLPRPCPGCGGPEPWCANCDRTIAGRPRRVVPPHEGAAGCPPLYALARYRGPVRGAVLAGKERGRRDVPARLGRALAAGVERLALIGVVDEPLWMVPAPTLRAAARRRGGDPVHRMVRAAAVELAARGWECGVAPCLMTVRGVRDSVGLDAAQRRRNLAGKIIFDPSGAPDPSLPVIFVDDVFTTGATCLSSASVLAAHGYPVSAVLVLASAAELVAERVGGNGPAPEPANYALGEYSELPPTRQPFAVCFPDTLQ